MASSMTMLDPDTASLDELDRELARLQRRYQVASHEVGERGVRPDGIDDPPSLGWVAAHRATWRRRFESSDSIATTELVEQVELRKTRLRKPPLIEGPTVEETRDTECHPACGSRRARRGCRTRRRRR